jgi:hypothetical protein
MTKIRTAVLLQDALDRDFAWRLKEIDDIRKEVRCNISFRKRTFIRAGVALLYAHWEGFVKTGADNYVNYLSCQGLRYRELQDCLIALGLKAHLNMIAESSRFAASTSAVNFILRELDNLAKLPMKDAIETRSNLNSEVFQEIAGWIGVDTAKYETKFNLVNESLVKRRNQIAHGEFLEIDDNAFHDFVDETLLLLRWFKTDLENAIAVNSHFAV